MVGKNLDKVTETIEDFAKNIAEELSEKRWYEVNEIKAVCTTRLIFAIQELLSIQLLDLEDQRAKMAAEYADPDTPNWRKMKLNAELGKIKLIIKQNNRLKSCFNDYNRYEQLVHFLKGRFGVELIEEFENDYLNQGENALNITKRTPDNNEK